MSSRRRALELSFGDGALYSFMAGVAEAYILADVVRQGAAVEYVVATAVVPALFGAVGARAAEGMLPGVSRRGIVVGLLLVQGLQLAALSLLAFTGATSPRVLLAGACSHQLLSALLATSWFSWFGDVVPSRLRGAYFARRQAWCQLASFAGIVAGGAVLQLGALRWTTNVAFALDYGLGAVCLFAAASFIARSWDGPLYPRQTPELEAVDGNALPAAGAVKAAPVKRRLSWAIPCMQVGLAVGSPFVAPLLLDHLQLSYAEFMMGLAALTATKSLTLPLWGSAIARFGPRRALVVSLLLSIPTGAAWIFAGGMYSVVLIQAVTGITLAGYELAVVAVLLAAGQQGQRSAVFSVMTARSAMGSFAGGALGYALVLDSNAFTAAFAASAVVRAAAFVLAVIETARAPDSLSPSTTSTSHPAPVSLFARRFRNRSR